MNEICTSLFSTCIYGVAFHLQGGGQAELCSLKQTKRRVVTSIC